MTGGSRAAGRRMTRVLLGNAFIILAHETVRAVRVNCTFRSTAGDSIRFRDVAGKTFTDGISKVINFAGCSRATRRRIAGIMRDTFFVFTNEALMAVAVYDALGTAAGDSVRPWHQSWMAVTNGVTGVIDLASSSRSTR